VDDDAKLFRNSRIGLLAFIASADQQQTFAAKVHYDNYASEFYCWWFDDFHPESDLFQRAFRPHEIELLSSFSAGWEQTDSAVGEVPRTIEALLANASWVALMAAAREAGARFGVGAT
jgi:hypothetical protein